MEPIGKGEKRILIMVESPTKRDDLQLAEPNKFLRNSLLKLNIDLDRDCWMIYSAQCRTHTNGIDREPRPIEVEHCRQRVWKDIEKLKPKVILLLTKPKTKKTRGGIALESFLGGRWKKDMGGINRWRGWTIPDRDVKAWVCPTFHPSFVLRSEREPVVKLVFEQDLKQAIECVDRPFPKFKDEADAVEKLPTPEKVRKYVQSLVRCKPSERPKLLSFDYETTGLKPHREGHRIVCASLTTDRGTVAFTVGDETKPILKGLLENPRIGKSAHNLGFEDQWSNVRLNGCVIAGWEWDSQMAAHVLDGRGKISSLKFQTYVNFGVIDYDSEISGFLKGTDDKDSNGFNRIDEAPIGKLLTYCGMDSTFGYQLTLLQMEQIREQGLQRAYDLFHEGLLSLAEMEQTGFVLDTEKCKTQSIQLAKTIKGLETGIFESGEGLIWKNKYGDKTKLNSPQQLSWMLFEYLKLKPTKMTAGNKPSVDESVLGELKSPLTKKLVRIRKHKKNLNTYLKGFMREEVNGLIHPMYHLNTARSYRSSSSRPNSQNFPIRSAEAHELVRGLIIPRKGNQLLDMDFKGAEVSVAAVVTDDPRLIEYVSDSTKDMHRDMAMQIYWLDKKQVSKDARYTAKNCFVFPQFYGDWHEPCAKNLWENITALGLKVKGTDTPMRDHLSDNGIKSFKKFVSHLHDVENDFWGNRFKVYDKWKIDQWKQYQKKGYIDLVTGFRCKEIMDKNAVLNRPIQGVAFHCLLWTLNRLTAMKHEENWQSLFTMQIHDSITLDTPPSELKVIIKATNLLVAEELPKAFDWLTIPMAVEYELCGIDESWYHKKEVNKNLVCP